jgi:PIN domain nuclease of toxin-antitoxin system
MQCLMSGTRLRILIDTSVLIFAALEPSRLTRKAFSISADSETTPEISIVSIAEIALKNATGKLVFPAIDVQHSMDDLEIRLLPFTADHAFRLFDLPLHHRDPFDRQIIAQSLHEKIPLITSDQKFSLYGGEILW